MIVVLDTNIVASATYWRGKPAHCLEAWVLGKYDLAISHPILTEYEEVIARLGTRYPAKHPTDWRSAIKQAGHGAPNNALLLGKRAPTARRGWIQERGRGRLVPE